MNYHKISLYDTANGPAIGTVLWVSGCEHHCPECHNPQTWDKNSGREFTELDMEHLLDSLKPDYISRLTLSGGDPLAPYNIDIVTSICIRVKELYPDKHIWLYTGYSWEEIWNYAIMDYVDVVVDGEFQIDKKDIGLVYCGSTNQRVIDVKKSKQIVSPVFAPPVEWSKN